MSAQQQRALANETTWGQWIQVYMGEGKGGHSINASKIPKTP